MKRTDKRTLSLADLRWTRVEIKSSKARRIPRIVNFHNRGVMFSVAVVIEEEENIKLGGTSIVRAQ